jgi:hypothetical protein
MQDACMRAHQDVIFRIGAYRTRSSNFQERLFKRPRVCTGKANQGNPLGCGRSYLGTVLKQRCSCRTGPRSVTAGRDTDERCSENQASEGDIGTEVLPSAGYAVNWHTPFLCGKLSNLIGYVVLEMHITEPVPYVWVQRFCAEMPDNAATNGDRRKDCEMAIKPSGGVDLLELPEKATEKATEGEKRLNLILSAGVYNDVARLAKEKRTTMTEIVRLALGLVKVAIREANQGNKLVVTKASGEVIKELILPG